jgi:adenosylhomocysteine nucleosidase
MMRKDGPVGLMAAIPQELAAHADLVIRDERVIAGCRFRRGRLGAEDLVAVEAGIGKTHAAMVATLLLQEFGCRALLFSGVAGGLDPDLGIGDVVVADRLVMHDYGARVDGRLKPYQPGVPPIPGFPEETGYALDSDLRQKIKDALEGIDIGTFGAAATGAEPHRSRLIFGTILTGDIFLNDALERERLHREFGGVAVEMEGAAVAAVAERFGIPVVVVRALSDLAGSESHMDFPAFLDAAAGIAARVVGRIVTAL